jgi:hypothetical protein
MQLLEEYGEDLDLLHIAVRSLKMYSSCFEPVVLDCHLLLKQINVS